MIRNSFCYNTISQINDDSLKFTNKLQIKDRLGKFKIIDAYFLFKDHKPNFEINNNLG